MANIAKGGDGPDIILIRAGNRRDLIFLRLVTRIDPELHVLSYAVLTRGTCSICERVPLNFLRGCTPILRGTMQRPQLLHSTWPFESQWAPSRALCHLRVLRPRVVSRTPSPTGVRQWVSPTPSISCTGADPVRFGLPAGLQLAAQGLIQGDLVPLQGFICLHRGRSRAIWAPCRAPFGCAELGSLHGVA